MLLFWLTLGGLIIGSCVFGLGIKNRRLRQTIVGCGIVLAPVVAHTLLRLI